MSGLIDRFNFHKGYGFIRPLIGQPDTAQSVFFHISSVRGGITPPIGAEVSFRLVRGQRGVQAADVQLREVSARRVLATTEEDVHAGR